MNNAVIDYGLNDILIMSDRREYIDFQKGSGSVILGNANPAVCEALKSQADKLWISGKYIHNRLDEAIQRIESYLRDDYYLAELYSTGMEAIEFSLRIAAIRTGKQAFAGFTNSVHGKSLAASSLSWNNPFSLANFHRIPFLAVREEGGLLEIIENLFKTEDIAAFYIEPIQGSAGGYEASPGFYQSLVELCKMYNVTSVVDEILTGFFRAGHASYALAHGIYPDIIVFGKSMGNGFPVSAVVLRKNIKVLPGMMPKSTYSSNPLACAAVCATLQEFKRINIAEKVSHIHSIVAERLKKVTDNSFKVRGKGALWLIEPPAHVNCEQLGRNIFDAGVVTPYTETHLRLLPPATIKESNLELGLKIVVDACLSYT